MWLRRFSSYLLAHTWQGAALVFIGAFIPVLGMFAILIAAFVTLCQGAIRGGILTLAATLPYAISVFLTNYHHDAALPLSVWAAVGVAVLSNVLTYVFALMLRRQTNFSSLFQIAALMGVLVISLIHLAFPDIATWWGDMLHNYYAQAKSLVTTLPVKLNETASDTQTAAINTTKFYATGLATAAILFNALIQLVVARWWQAFIFKPGLLRFELHRIRLAPLAGVLFIAGLGLAYWGNTVVVDIMPVVYLLFGVAGLSLVHYFFGTLQTQTAWFWLVIVYLTLFLLLPVSILIVSILALADCWFDLRKRLLHV